MNRSSVPNTGDTRRLCQVCFALHKLNTDEREGGRVDGGKKTDRRVRGRARRKGACDGPGGGQI
mgnify:CR=1 FL=1